MAIEHDEYLYVRANNPLDAIAFFGLPPETEVKIADNKLDEKGRLLFAVKTPVENIRKNIWGLF